MDLYSGIYNGGIDSSYWNSVYTSAGLKSNMWLFVYETTVKRWVQPLTPCFVNAHPLFGPMLRKQESAIPMRNAMWSQRGARLTRQRAHDRVAKLIFANIDDYF